MPDGAGRAFGARSLSKSACVRAMAVGGNHPDYDATLPQWLRARDVLSGEDAVKAAGERYLPRLDSQSEKEYSAYRHGLLSLGQRHARLRSIWTWCFEGRRWFRSALPHDFSHASARQLKKPARVAPR